MAEPKIENLEALIQKYTGPQFSLVGHKIANLTAPGENYASIMLKVDVTMKNKDTEKTEEIHAVAKCALELGNNLMRKGLNSFGFQNELNFYEKVIPTLLKFQDDQGVKNVLDIFPKMYTARLNMNGDSDDVDQDAILLLENLKTQGYSSVDRHICFDFEGAKLILKDLAAFHAVPLALKLKNSEEFEEKIMKFCRKLHLPPPPPKGLLTKKPPNIWMEVLEEHETCRKFLTPKLREMLEGNHVEKSLNKPVREPFGTISHNDVWTSNIMQKVANGRLVDNKFLDFQMCTYGSPTDDLALFLFTSVQLQVLKDHLDELIHCYHGVFISILESYKCPVEPFSYEKFIEEFKFSQEFGLLHTFSRNFVIFTEKERALQVGPGFQKKKEDITPAARDRMVFLVEELGGRGWI